MPQVQGSPGCVPSSKCIMQHTRTFGLALLYPCLPSLELIVRPRVSPVHNNNYPSSCLLLDHKMHPISGAQRMSVVRWMLQVPGTRRHEVSSIALLYPYLRLLAQSAYKFDWCLLRANAL